MFQQLISLGFPDFTTKKKIEASLSCIQTNVYEVWQLSL